MLLFKDIKQNYPVYILDKINLNLIEGKVTQVSFPHIDPRNNSYNNNSPMVVDVTISDKDKTATYTIPEHLCITDAGNNLVLSTEKENLSREVEAMKNSALQILNSVDRQKNIIEKADVLLKELNPSFKDKAIYEERFKNLENGMCDIKDLLRKFIDRKNEEEIEIDYNKKVRSTENGGGSRQKRRLDDDDIN